MHEVRRVEFKQNFGIIVVDTKENTVSLSQALICG